MKKRRTLVGVATLAVFISAAAGVSYGLLPCTKSTTICLLGKLHDKYIEVHDSYESVYNDDRQAIDNFVRGKSSSLGPEGYAYAK